MIRQLYKTLITHGDPRVVALIEKIAEESPKGAFIAGGAVASLIDGDPIKDIDIFVTPDLPAAIFTNRLEANGWRKTKDGWDSYYEETINRMVATYSYDGFPDIQIMKTLATSLGELFADFDFTVCQFAIPTGKPLEYIYHGERSYEDLLDRTLRVNHFQGVHQLNKRIERYKKKGFEPTLETISKTIPYLPLRQLSETLLFQQRR